MRIVLIAALFAVASLISFATQAQEATLSVTGELKEPLKLTMTELKAIPTTHLTVKDHDGTTATYEGVLLHAILSRGEYLRVKLCAARPCSSLFW